MILDSGIARRAETRMRWRLRMIYIYIDKRRSRHVSHVNEPRGGRPGPAHAGRCARRAEPDRRTAERSNPAQRTDPPSEAADNATSDSLAAVLRSTLATCYNATRAAAHGRRQTTTPHSTGSTCAAIWRATGPVQASEARNRSRGVLFAANAPMLMHGHGPDQARHINAAVRHAGRLRWLHRRGR